MSAFTNTDTLERSLSVISTTLGIGRARNYVVGLYEGLLQRQPDEPGYETWRAALLSQSLTDTAVLADFVDSPEFVAKNSSNLIPNTVALSYQTLLGRAPTTAELNDGVAFLDGGNGPQALAQALISSDEFTQNGYSQNIQHTVVVYQENWSFDGLFGLFAGVNGITGVNPAAIQQLKRDGVTFYDVLPQSSDVPVNLPVQPFNLAPFVPPTRGTQGDPHTSSQQQLQINNGLMNARVVDLSRPQAHRATISHELRFTQPALWHVGPELYDRRPFLPLGLRWSMFNAPY